MKRSDFFKSVVGLIGVAGSLKELSLINTPVIELLPYNTRIGDLVMSSNRKVFMFDGKFIRGVTDGSRTLAKIGTSASKYQRFANACGEG